MHRHHALAEPGATMEHPCESDGIFFRQRGPVESIESPYFPCCVLGFSGSAPEKCGLGSRAISHVGHTRRPTRPPAAGGANRSALSVSPRAPGPATHHVRTKTDMSPASEAVEACTDVIEDLPSELE